MKYRQYVIPAFALGAVILLVIYFIRRPADPQPERTLPEHLTGWIASDPDDIARLPMIDTARLTTADGGLPPQFELEMPPARDQGQEGSCCAFACGYAARSYLLHNDQQIDYTQDSGAIDPYKIFSPEFIYNTARETQSDDCGQAGMKLTRALDLIRTKGAAPWAFMPYSSENGCSQVPDSVQNQAASYFTVKKVERIPHTSEQLIKKIIFSKNPVIFSARIDAGFMKNGKTVWNKPDPSVLGGHAMVLCGWDDTKHAYKVMNSWGEQWGENGFGWIDYTYFTKVVSGSNGVYEMFTMTNGYDPSLLPVVVTTKNDYAYSNTLFSGEIVTQGAAPITACGICYSTKQSPTIQDSRSDGMLEAGKSILSNPLDDLRYGKTYYIRAYAVTPYGTAYGNEIRFYYYVPTAKLKKQPAPLACNNRPVYSK